MQRGVWLLVFGVVVASLGVASARAAAGAAGTTTTDSTTTGTTTTVATTTTATTTTATTTTSTSTTTATTPAYAPLTAYSLPNRCVGAGAAAVLFPSHRTLAVGVSASNLGPSSYTTATGTALSFESSFSRGSGCSGTKLTLTSVSLFDGAVTAGTVEGRDGRGNVASLAIEGVSASLKPGQTALVGDWARLTIDTRIGRVSGPLVIRLLREHDSLPAGTTVAVAFAASARPGAKRLPRRAGHRNQQTRDHHPSNRRHGQQRGTPDFPNGPSPFLLTGALADAAQHNPVTALAIKYLGVPYVWGGARPKTGFDCSGLVKYVFAQLGVDLPHFAAAQYYYPDAVAVPANRLQPGDLVFFTGSDGTRKMPGHVGIYIGDGYLVDAPHTGASVQIDSLDERWFARSYVGARKILGASGDVGQLLAVTKATAANPSVALLRAGAPQFGLEAPGRFSVASASTLAIPAGAGSRWIAAAATGGLLSLLVAGVFPLRRRIRRAVEREWS